MHYRFEKKNITDSKKHQHFPAQTPTQIRAAPFEKIKIKTHDRNSFQRGTRVTNTQIIRPSNEPTRQSINSHSAILGPTRQNITRIYEAFCFLFFFFTPTAFESTISKIQIFSKPLYFYIQVPLLFCYYFHFSVLQSLEQ